MSCKDCNLCKKAVNTCVTGIGSRGRKTEIMIVQDAPTFLEDRYGNSLVGEIKDKLNYFLNASGIDYKKVYFTNAVKCRPNNLSEIKNKHYEACEKYLFSEILEHQPKLIIASGKHAYAMLSDFQSIREFRGHFDDFNLTYENDSFGKTTKHTFSCKVMPTWSINASLMKWEYNDDIIRDFTKGKKYVDTDKIEMITPPVVNTILTVNGLNDFVERYREAKYATTDFETTGFDFWKHKIINAGYCDKKGRADIIYVTPYGNEHILDKKWTKEERDRAKQINSFLKSHRHKCMNALKTVNGFENLKLILHNGKFDIKFSWANKIPYKNFWFDTLMADSLIDENLGHALNIAMERRNINYGAYDTKLWPYINKDEKNKKSYQYVPPQLLEKYLGVDVDGDMRLFHKQWKELKEEGMTDHLLKRKMVTIRNVAKKEFIGFKADKSLIEKASRSIEKLQDELQEKLNEHTKIEGFNPNSPLQILEFMHDKDYPFKKLKIKKTKTGFSTGKEELQKFINYKPKFAEFPQLLLNAKKLSKIKGTYVDGKDGLGGMVQYLDKRDRIHPSYNLHSPRTGRESCSSPSIQVWPRPIKGLINPRNFVIPTNKNWNFFEADYSALEIHIVAYLSQDKLLIKRLQKGMDLHCINANDLGHILKTVPDWVTYEHLLATNGKGGKIKDDKMVAELIKECNAKAPNIDWHEIRTQAKNIGFGLNYGKGAETFAKEFKIPVEEAIDMIDGYFDIYYGMKDWRDRTVEKAITEGYIELLSGRKRRFFGATDWANSPYGKDSWSTKRLIEEISRQAMNFPVQGGGQEVFEPALIRLDRRIKKEKLKARIMFRIHDGILGECPIEENEIMAKILFEELTYVFDENKRNELKLNVDVDFYAWEWYGEKRKV